MPAPNDPSTTTRSPLRAMAPQAPGVCGLCLGAGQYLEAVYGDPFGELLQVQCVMCDGTGHRRRT